MAKAEKGRYSRIAHAKEVCRRCDNRVDCLIWALETKQPYGVWGASTERDRRVMLRQIADGQTVRSVAQGDSREIRKWQA